MPFITERDRLETFGNWPLRGPPFPLDLVQAGFYYTGPFDQVTCAFCYGVVNHWKPTDDPLEEHQKHFPQCMFVNEQLRKAQFSAHEPGLPAQRNEPAPIRFAMAKENQIINPSNIHVCSPQSSHLSNQQTYQPTTGLCIPVIPSSNNIQQVDFTKEENRIKSFANWPRVDQQPRELARAGLYYLGNLDRVKCFSCKTVFRDWLPGDDPWIEHSKWQPDCKYLKMCLGDEIVEDIHKEMTKHMPRDVVDAES